MVACEARVATLLQAWEPVLLLPASWPALPGPPCWPVALGCSQARRLTCRWRYTGFEVEVIGLSQTILGLGSRV